MLSNLIKKYNSCPVQIKASIWFTICAFLQKGISMLTTPIFTRLMSTTEYGQFSVYSSWLSIATAFIGLNLTGGVYTQGLIKYSKDRDKYSSSLQGLSTTLALLWIIIYILTPDIWKNLLNMSSIQILVMILTIWTTSVFNFWSNEQRVEYKYKALVILTLIVSFLKPVLGIIIVLYSKDKVTARIVELFLVEFVAYIWLYIYQLKKGKTFFDLKYWKNALVFSIPLIPHYLSQIVLNSADRIMIDRMEGSAQAGIYSLAYSISSIMTLFNVALMQTISPWIYGKIKANKIKEIRSVAYITLVFIAIVNIGLILVAPEAVALFAPKSYYDAIWIIPPVALSSYFMFSFDLFAKFAFYYEKTVTIMFASTIGAVLNIILNYIFIGKFGYRAAGYTTLICYMVYSIAHYCIMNKVCKKYCNGIIPYDTKIIFGLSFIYVCIGILLILTYSNILIRYSIIIILIVILIICRNKIIDLIKKIMTLKNINNV